MQNSSPSTGSAHANAARTNVKTAVVRVEAIKDSFPSVVRSLGGDPDAILARENINPRTLDQPNALLNYRTLINLLETSAAELRCPDFGLRLAKQTSDGVSVTGPMAVAMRNSKTLRDAFEYCAKHVQVYSSAIHISLEREEWGERDFLLFDILLDGVPRQRQIVEHALGLTHNAAKSLSNSKVVPQEIWFAHGPLAPPASYREFFHAPVKFGMPYNALFFGKEDLAKPIDNRNPQLYEMAVSYIDLQFPLSTVLLTTQVSVILGRLLATGRCTQIVVAEMLAMHPRTFQRRLREEGTTFEAIVDVVRREVALRNLADTKVPLTRIAEKLGYSEVSVLTRSCYRWFSASPRQLRKEFEAYDAKGVDRAAAIQMVESLPASVVAPNRHFD